MERGQHAVDHREYEDLLAAAALGALTPDEHAALRAHLQKCPSCRSAYGRLVSVADALPLAVEERSPSASLRARLQSQVAVDARERQRETPPPVPLPVSAAPASQARSARRNVLPFRVGWAVAAAALLLLGIVGGVAVDRLLLGDDEPEDTQSIALQFPTDVQVENADLTYLPNQQILQFSAPNLPNPPPGNVYQVWLIEGETPRPVGVVDSDTGEFVTTVDPDRYDAFAITVEPGPLGSPGPTSDPIIVAPLESESFS